MSSELPKTGIRGQKGEQTRERILVKSGELFAAKGFFGTATRDIAAASGLQQPSLFFHFASKQAIAEELLAYSLSLPKAFAKLLVDEPSSAAVRLYSYISFDTKHLAGSPYDLTGIHQDGLLSLPEFRRWKRSADKLSQHIRTLIRQGHLDGSLLSLDPVLAQQMISGINLNTIRRMSHKQRGMSGLPEFVADFILRGLLSEARTLHIVRKEARVLLARVSSEL
jgi:AcrR family transcriptional regulator